MIAYAERITYFYFKDTMFNLRGFFFFLLSQGYQEAKKQMCGPLPLYQRTLR